MNGSGQYLDDNLWILSLICLSIYKKINSWKCRDGMSLNTSCVLVFSEQSTKWLIDSRIPADIPLMVKYLMINNWCSCMKLNHSMWIVEHCIIGLDVSHTRENRNESEILIGKWIKLIVLIFWKVDVTLTHTFFYWLDCQYHRSTRIIYFQVQRWRRCKLFS